ncbi:MAG: zinc ribbon domain-containing protein [Halanaerobiales bacterium]
MPILWFVFCGAVAYFAHQKGRSAIGWGLLAVFISPLIAGIALAIAKDLSVERDFDYLHNRTDNLEREIRHNKEYSDLSREYLRDDVRSLSANRGKSVKLSGSNRQETAQKALSSSKVKCSNCEKYIEPENRFCPSCGEKIIPEGMMECSECGELLEKGSKFCNKCGKKLVVTCISCNQSYDLGTKFCPSCGENLGNNVTPLVDNKQQG